MHIALHSRLAATLPFLASALGAGPDAADYGAVIAPLFQEHCVDCHGKDDPDGEFDIESFASLMKGGKDGKAVIPGNAADSRLVKFLEGRSGKTGKNRFMPPGKRDHLKPDQIALVRRWIDAGAPAPTAERRPADVIASLPKIAPKDGLRRTVSALAFAAEGGLLAEGSFASVRVLDAATLAPMRAITGIEGRVNALVFSADGATLFAGAGDAGLAGVAYQFRLSDGALVRKFEGHSDAIHAVALSPDGKTLATGSYDQKIRLWNTATGEQVGLLKGHNGGVFGLSFRGDGRVLASASGDRTVKLWDVASRKRLDTFSQPLKEQSAVAFAPDGRTLAAAGADNRIRVWNVTEKAAEGSNKLLSTRYAHEGAILALVFSADGGLLATAASDRAVKIWDAKSQTELHLLDKQPDWAPALAFVGNGKLAVGRLDGSLGIYDSSSGKAATGAAKTAPARKTSKTQAAPGRPQITRIEPHGFQAGASTTIQIIGKNLEGLKDAKMSDPRVAAKVTGAGASAATIVITAPRDLPRAAYKLTLGGPAGAAPAQELHADDLPQVGAGGTSPERLPVNVWGTLAGVGQQDSVRFGARRGETIVLDLAAKRIGSKIVSPRLEIFDSGGKLLDANNGLDSGADPFLAFSPTQDGEFIARVREITLEGSVDRFYRLTIGAVPYITAWWPLAVPPDRESEIHLIGPNLPARPVSVKSGAEGEVALPMDAGAFRSRIIPKVAISRQPVADEREPNDSAAESQPVSVPISVNGRLHNEARPGTADADLFRFEAVKGRPVIIETRAAMAGSPADTKIEVLDAKGGSVPMLALQATKDSWITLRSEDANDPAIRLGQFAELELNDYMYFNGEVLKVFRLARGPDADTVFFANGGKRRAYFNSSPAAHGLDDACYAVEPKSVGAALVPNGLPVFTIHYSNDDDGEREIGRDSRLLFNPPATGPYLVRVTDTRGWSGDRFAYRLILREPVPDFAVKLLTTPGAVSIPAGSGIQFTLAANRINGFNGDVRIDVSGVPEGFYASSPLVIQAGHLDAAGCLYARAGTKPGVHDFAKASLTATATAAGRQLRRAIAGFPKVSVTPAPKKVLLMEPDLAGRAAGDGKSAPAAPYEIVIAPGTTVSAWLRVDRRGDDALIACDVENLPHGVIVDNIGLNGVQIRAGENEREISLSCAKWVPEQDRLCQVVAGSARNDAAREIGTQAGFPVLLKVRKPAPVVVK